ncbi:MAG: GNAT family N-acetyltransferase [Microbacteriaceae bacterium]
MTATRPTGSLVGRFIRLDLMTDADLPELFAAIAHPVVFAAGYGGGPLGLTDNIADFRTFAHGYFDLTASNVYVARVIGGPHDGELVGTSTLGDFDLKNEHAHIGWTAWDPRVWGTAVNAEAKMLMLGAAFDNGFGRVKIQTDSINTRSRAAIDGIGATFEGIVRRDRLRADGTWRDTALFAVIVDDWPHVRAGLEARLAAQGERPVLFRSMPASSDARA